MNDFKVGYAKVNINPPLGIGVAGYYIPRYAKGILDDLEASALVLSCAGKQIALISVDCCNIKTDLEEEYLVTIGRATGLPKENIFMTATHTHTGAVLVPPGSYEVDEEMVSRYATFVKERLVDVVKLALADQKPAKMGCMVGYAPDRVAYIRRYKSSQMRAPYPNRICPLNRL